MLVFTARQIHHATHPSQGYVGRKGFQSVKSHTTLSGFRKNDDLWKSFRGSQVNLCPRAVPWELNLCLKGRLKATLEIFLWQTLGHILGQTLGQKPLGPAAPRVFWPWVWPRMWPWVCFRKIPRVAFNLPLGQRLSSLGTALGHRFTWLPPQLFHRLSHWQFKLRGPSHAKQ